MEASTKRVLDDARDVKQAAELFNSKSAAQIRDFRENVEKSVVDFMHKDGLDACEVDDWLMARHVAERNRRMLEINPGVKTDSGMSHAQANAVLAKYCDNSLNEVAAECRVKPYGWLYLGSCNLFVHTGHAHVFGSMRWS